jgi:hypothetical protein
VNASPRCGQSAAGLDDRILETIRAWHETGAALDDAAFDRLALDLYAYQFATNAPYRRFAEAAGFGARAPADWREIPAVPASAFKDATLATFDPAAAELEFHTSGSTGATPGKHFMQRAELYDAALLAGFDRFMLADGARLRYLNLVPDARERPQSSLGYMMRSVTQARGDGAGGFFLRGDEIDVAGIRAALAAAGSAGVPVCVAGTAFAFVALWDALEASVARFACAPGSRVMETGGFKGRSRVVERDDLYDGIAARLGIAREAIVAEYGMTELTSQWYDAPATRGARLRSKAGPPWLRALVVDAEGRELPPGEPGFLRHVDLANRSSVLAVQTEDRGYATPDGFVLLGRDMDAPLRGCSLDAEELVARRG